MLTEKPIRLHLLGQPNIFVGGKPFRLGMPHKTLPLLGYVILHRGGPVLRGRAAFSLWPGESEEEALGKLRRTIYLLSRALPPPPPLQPGRSRCRHCLTPTTRLNRTLTRRRCRFTTTNITPPT